MKQPHKPRSGTPDEVEIGRPHFLFLIGTLGARQRQVSSMISSHAKTTRRLGVFAIERVWEKHERRKSLSSYRMRASPPPARRGEGVSVWTRYFIHPRACGWRWRAYGTIVCRGGDHLPRTHKRCNQWTELFADDECRHACMPCILSVEG